MNYIKHSINIKLFPLVVLFACGKIVSATGQTLFNTQHALTYMLINNQASIVFITKASIFAAICTFMVILITRVPAIYRQFQFQRKTNLNSSDLTHKTGKQKFLYNTVVVCSLIAGFFSSIGAYLGAITIIELIVHVRQYIMSDVDMMAAQAGAVTIAIASFSSYYSFNMQKAKLNSMKLITKTSKLRRIIFEKNFQKTMMISFLNILSMPFIAYYLTKNAMCKMPCVHYCLCPNAIIWIALFSALTSLIAGLATTVAAMYDYFAALDNSTSSRKEPVYWSMLRQLTYGTGIIDCGATGLGNFLGVITIAHDIFDTAIYNSYVITLAIACGVSSFLLNLVFSIRQGFNDLVHHFQKAYHHVPI